MADFSKYTNYKNNAGVSSVVFGAKATVLEVELNEMQEIQKHLINSIIKNIMGDGISDISKLTYDKADNIVRILDDCWMTAGGYCINCSNTWINVSEGNTVYLQVWEEVVDHNSVLNLEGYNKATEYVDNWIRDTRASSETTKRMVVKYTLATQTNSARLNVPIAKISNGVMTKLVKEVNLGKLYNRVDSMDEYDMRDVYGVEVDFENYEITRLAGAVGKSGGTDFDNIRAFDRRRCLITETDGNLLTYLNNGATYPSYYNPNTGLTTAAATATNGASVASGSRVNIMVRQNKFYYKVVPVKIDKMDNYDESKGYNIRKVRYYISDTYKPGFKVHPAFIKTQKSGAKLEFNEIYIGAYKSVAYNADGLVNDQTYEDEVAELDFSTDGLTSVAGKVPVSGLYYNMTMANIRRLLTNMDENGFWRMKDITVMSMDILLFLIEYATFDAQSILGKGYVDVVDKDNTFNWANVTGGTASLGNKSSIPLSNNGLHSISYRGEEDIYGGLFEFVEGYIADTKSKWTDTLHPFGSYPIYDNVNFYQDIGMPVGYVSAFGYNYDHDWMFIPTEINNDKIFIKDTVQTVGTYDGSGYILTYGGGWHFGNSAGICCLRLVLDTKSVNYGSRIVYFPYKLGKSIE